MVGYAGNESRFLEFDGGLAISPDGDASVGIGCRVGQPRLGFAGVEVVSLGQVIELKVDVDVEQNFSLQDRINSIYFDKQIEGKCDRCGKVNKKYILSNKKVN